MSSNPQSYAFPQRAPIFTAFIVLVGIGIFGWVVYRHYDHARPVNPLALGNPADFAEDVRWKMDPKGRAKHLSDLRAHEAGEANSYGWVDQKSGVVRIPISRAMDLIVEENAKK
ncbi:MAG TPA: hypothetical protein VHD32_05650 [Candidatus Didemnitutus sp.]|nr:hypothetical protein [Candidatus Didemnitutus sp.]